MNKMASSASGCLNRKKCRLIASFHRTNPTKDKSTSDRIYVIMTSMSVPRISPSPPRTLGNCLRLPLSSTIIMIIIASRGLGKVRSIKSTAQMSETEITFLETKVYKGLSSTRNQSQTGKQIINQPGAYEPNRSLSHQRRPRRSMCH